jgi:hypothetical protein
MPRHLDSELDSAILKTLMNRKTIGYNDLYRLLEKTFRHTSRDAYDRHIRRLKGSGNIERKDKGAKGGKLAHYSITDKGILMLRLFGSQEEHRQELPLRLKRAFQMLFFFEAKRDPHFKEMYCTEDGLVEYIRSKYNVPFTRKDLIIDHQFRKDVDCIVTVYLPVSSYIQIVKEEFNRVSSEPVETTSPVPRRKDNENMLDGPPKNGRPQQPQSRESKDNEQKVFLVETLGITINQILNDKTFAFQHLGFTPSELQQAFNTLKEEKLIKPNGVHGNDIYYTMASDELYDLIRRCWLIYNLVMEKMSQLWMYCRRPTYQERKWLELFKGTERAKTWIKEDNVDRRKTKLKRRLEQSQIQEEQRAQLRHSLTAINKGHDNMSQHTSAVIHSNSTSTLNEEKEEIAILDKLNRVDVQNLKKIHAITIRKYSFPFDEIMNELVYPPFLQDIASTIPTSE